MYIPYQETDKFWNVASTVGTRKDSKGSKAQPIFEVENFGKSYGLHTQESENCSAGTTQGLPVGTVPISRKR